MMYSSRSIGCASVWFYAFMRSANILDLIWLCSFKLSAVNTLSKDEEYPEAMWLSQRLTSVLINWPHLWTTSSLDGQRFFWIQLQVRTHTKLCFIISFVNNVLYGVCDDHYIGHNFGVEPIFPLGNCIVRSIELCSLLHVQFNYIAVLAVGFHQGSD